MLLTSALQDTDTFIADATPDNFWLLVMLDWHVLLKILVHGPSLGDILEELQVGPDV